MRGNRYDLVVDLQGLLRSALLAYATGAPVRVGSAEAREGAPWFYTHQVPMSVVHAVDRNLALVHALGIPVAAIDFGFSKGTVAASCFHNMGVPEETPMAVLHPITRRKNKQWPLENFTALADRLHRAGLMPVFIGAPSDRLAIDTILSSMKQSGINRAGHLGWPQLIALFRQAKWVIGNDSGPLHLAAAAGARVVALFGPTDPMRVGPYGEGHRVVRQTLGCIGCTRHRCRNDHACMNAISVEHVVSALQSGSADALSATH